MVKRIKWGCLIPAFLTILCFLHVQIMITSTQQKGQGGAPEGSSHSVRVYSPSTRSDDTAAVCLIVRNETLYIDEWADYHIALGFSPIYLYDNAGEPDLELLMWWEGRPDIQEHIKIIHFPQAPVQQAAYQRCIERDAKNDTFAAFIDIDEFVVLKKHDNVIDFLVDHCDEDCGQISLNWKMFSVERNSTYSALPVTKRNVHHEGQDSLWSTVKVIARVAYVAPIVSWSHTVALKKGSWVDTSGKKIRRSGGWKKQHNYGLPSDVALLYHYRFKSEEEFYWKNCIRGDSLQERGVVPKCTREAAVVGMYLTNEVDDTAWRKLVKMIPWKYSVYDEA